MPTLSNVISLPTFDELSATIAAWFRSSRPLFDALSIDSDEGLPNFIASVDSSDISSSLRDPQVRQRWALYCQWLLECLRLADDAQYQALKVRIATFDVSDGSTSAFEDIRRHLQLSVPTTDEARAPTDSGQVTALDTDQSVTVSKALDDLLQNPDVIEALVTHLKEGDTTASGQLVALLKEGDRQIQNHLAAKRWWAFFWKTLTILSYLLAFMSFAAALIVVSFGTMGMVPLVAFGLLESWQTLGLSIALLFGKVVTNATALQFGGWLLGGVVCGLLAGLAAYSQSSIEDFYWFTQRPASPLEDSEINPFVDDGTAFDESGTDEAAIDDVDYQCLSCFDLGVSTWSYGDWFNAGLKCLLVMIIVAAVIAGIMTVSLTTFGSVPAAFAFMMMLIQTVGFHFGATATTALVVGSKVLVISGVSASLFFGGVGLAAHYQWNAVADDQQRVDPPPSLVSLEAEPTDGAGGYVASWLEHFGIHSWFASSSTVPDDSQPVEGQSTYTSWCCPCLV